MLRNLATFVGCLLIAFFAGKYQARQEIKAEVTRIETQMQEAATQAADKLHKEKQDAQTQINRLRADVASGAVSLSVRARCSATDAAGDPETRAELDPTAAQELISIAADGDQAIIELNACIDFYNDLRKIK